MFHTIGIKFSDGRVLNRLDSAPYQPFDTGWRTILGFLIRFIIVNLSIVHNSSVSVLWLTHWLYQWIMIQFLLFGGQTFLWIASAVMNFEQCIYENSSFYDVMFDISLTSTSFIHHGIRYAPLQSFVFSVGLCIHFNIFDVTSFTSSIGSFFPSHVYFVFKLGTYHLFYQRTHLLSQLSVPIYLLMELGVVVIVSQFVLSHHLFL